MIKLSSYFSLAKGKILLCTDIKCYKLVFISMLNYKSEPEHLASLRLVDAPFGFQTTNSNGVLINNISVKNPDFSLLIML